MKLEDCKPGTAVEFKTFSGIPYGIIKEPPQEVYSYAMTESSRQVKILYGHSITVILNTGYEVKVDVTYLRKYVRRPKNGTI
jgi:hypothetical protein